MSITDALENYTWRVLKAKGKKQKTIANYSTAINSLVDVVGDIPVELFSSVHKDMWELELRAQGKPDTTIQTYLGKMRQILKFHRKEGMNLLDPELIELPKVTKSSKPWLHGDEIEKMLEVASRPRDKALIACLASMGCRISELLKLKRKDVEESDEVLVHGKNDSEYWVYLDARARHYLDDYLRSRTDGYSHLFLTDHRTQIGYKRVWQILHEVADKAGIEKNVTAHLFRHSFATDLLINEAPMDSVQKLMGHKSISTTIDIYSHVPQPKHKQVFYKYHAKNASQKVNSGLRM